MPNIQSIELRNLKNRGLQTIKKSMVDLIQKWLIHFGKKNN
jgi:hypothetical protein